MDSTVLYDDDYIKGATCNFKKNFFLALSANTNGTFKVMYNIMVDWGWGLIPLCGVNNFQGC